MGSQTHYPGVMYQCYHRGGVGILPCNTLLILLSAAILPLSSLPLSALLTIYPDHSSLPLTLYFSLLEFRLPFARSRKKPLSQDEQEKDSKGEGKGDIKEWV